MKKRVTNGSCSDVCSVGKTCKYFIEREIAMKKRGLQFGLVCVMLLVPVVWTNVASASVLFNETCENLDAWTGASMDRMSADGKFNLNAGNTDSNVYMYTNGTFSTPGDVTFSFDNGYFNSTTNSGHVLVGLVGDTAHYSESLGLGVKFTEYGEGAPYNGTYYYNGTAHDFASTLMPEGHWNTMAIKIEYFSATNRLLITQISGMYFDGSGHATANNTVLVDQIMGAAYDYASYDKVLYTANTKYHGTSVGSIDNIVLEVVPEPVTVSMLICGAIVAFCRRRRR